MKTVWMENPCNQNAREKGESPLGLHYTDQIECWVEGEWKHNDVRDECTPDFGCCFPSLRELDKNVRQELSK